MNRLLFTKIMFTLDEFETYTKKKVKKFKYENGILYITAEKNEHYAIAIEEVEVEKK